MVAGRSKSQTITIDNADNHAWNKVKILGQWVNLDVTFDLTISGTDFVRHDYFLCSDFDLRNTHAQNTFPLGIDCNSSDLSYYAKYGLIAHNPTELKDICYRSAMTIQNVFEVKLCNVKYENKIEQKIEQLLEEAFSNSGVSRYRYSFNKEMMTLFVKII